MSRNLVKIFLFDESRIFQDSFQKAKFCYPLVIVKKIANDSCSTYAKWGYISMTRQLVKPWLTKDISSPWFKNWLFMLEISKTAVESEMNSEWHLATNLRDGFFMFIRLTKHSLFIICPRNLNIIAVNLSKTSDF